MAVVGRPVNGDTKTIGETDDIFFPFSISSIRPSLKTQPASGNHDVMVNLVGVEIPPNNSLLLSRHFPRLRSFFFVKQFLIVSVEEKKS